MEIDPEALAILTDPAARHSLVPCSEVAVVRGDTQEDVLAGAYARAQDGYWPIGGPLELSPGLWILPMVRPREQ